MVYVSSSKFVINPGLEDGSSLEKELQKFTKHCESVRELYTDSSPRTACTSQNTNETFFKVQE